MVRYFFDVQDTVVQQTLESLVNYTPKIQRPVIVGGIAVQLYKQMTLPGRELLRPTSDVDIIDPLNRSYEDFVSSVGGAVQRWLIREGNYQVQLKRGKAKNEVKIMKGQGARAEELFFAHFTRYNPDTFARTGAITAREVANANNTLYSLDEEKQLRVKRVEDILPYKLRRVRDALTKLTEQGDSVAQEPLYQALLKSAEDSAWDVLARIDLDHWCEGITTMQNDLVGHNSPATNVKLKYTINKDLYDTCILARVISAQPAIFNRAYFLNAKNEVNTI